MTEFVQRLSEIGPVWAAAMWRAAWQGGLAILTVWILCLTVPKLPGRVRCWAWRLAFAKLLICLIWTAPVKLALLPPAKAPIVVVSAVRSSPAGAPVLASAPAARPVISVQRQAAPVKLGLPGVLLALWILGVGMGLLGIIRQWLQARRMILTSSRLLHEGLETDLAVLSAHFRISRVPEVRVSNGMGTPVLSGLLRPVIIVPSGFLGEKSPAQLRMMIGHELAHVKRRDLWWAWMAIAARVVFFFHPLIWLAGRENRLAAEMAADELAVTVCQLEPVDYAGMLVEVAARIFQPQKEDLVAAVVGSHQTLKRRLQAMKHIRSLSNKRMTAMAVLFSVVGLFVLVPWQVVAQDAKSRTKPFLSQEDHPMAQGKVEVQVDAAGTYRCGGHTVELDDLAKDADLKAGVMVQVDPKAPVHALAALLSELDKAGAHQVSVATGALAPFESRIPDIQTLVSFEPRILDIDFGVWRPTESTQHGPAAAGNEGDYWNAVAVAWNNDHTEQGLKFANGDPSAVAVRMVNLAGAWASDGIMGVKDPMYNNYNYPVNNQGGNSKVILKQIPPGKYNVYLYGHERFPQAYGDFTLTVGGRNYGRKATSNQADAIENTSWVEGSQYVKYSNVEVQPGSEMEILIQPGGQVTDHWGRTFSDAVINGLQLIPVQ